MKETYRCENESCPNTTTVWTEDDRWLGRDLSGQAVFLQCRHVPPFPPSWSFIGGSYFCPFHKLTVHPAQVAGKVLAGSDEEFVTVGGLAALEKP